MSKFRKSEPREVPSLNTASLPDLIFTLLFFFMIVTNMREVPLKLHVKIPVASELQKLEEKSLVTYIIVDKKAPVIQVNADFVTLKELSGYLNRIREKVNPGDRDKMLVVLRIDKDTKMGLVNDIKQALRENNMLTVHYSTERKETK